MTIFAGTLETRPGVEQRTAGEVHRYPRSLDGGWVKSETTVDTFKAGSPDAVVSGIDWRDGAYAVDAGFPVAFVNHPVSEEFAMKLLADHLRRRFPRVPVHHIPGQCRYSLVRSA